MCFTSLDKKNSEDWRTPTLDLNCSCETDEPIPCAPGGAWNTRRVCEVSFTLYNRVMRGNCLREP